MQTKEKQRVLITGSLGYIGSSLIAILEKAGAEYRALDMRALSSGKQVKVDLRNREATHKSIVEFNPTVVIHAGTHSAIAYRDTFDKAFEEDFSALASLKDALKEISNVRLVYFSSNYVYSGYARGERVDEVAHLLPAHNFGIAKAFFEQYILRNHTNSVIFRLSSVFGPGRAQFPNAISNLVEEAKATHKVSVWGTGGRMMQYVYLPDVTRFVLSSFAIEPGIYNIGGDEYLSVADVARVVAEFFHATLTFQNDKREGETLAPMDTTKLQGALPGEHFTPLPKALKEYLTSLK